MHGNESSVNTGVYTPSSSNTRGSNLCTEFHLLFHLRTVNSSAMSDMAAGYSSAVWTLQQFSACTSEPHILAIERLVGVAGTDTDALERALDSV